MDLTHNKTEKKIKEELPCQDIEIKNEPLLHAKDIKREVLTDGDEIDQIDTPKLSAHVDVKVEASRTTECVKLEICTDESGARHNEKVGDNVYDVLIDIDDMKIEYNEDGTLRRQQHDQTHDERQKTLLNDFENPPNKPIFKTEEKEEATKPKVYEYSSGYIDTTTARKSYLRRRCVNNDLITPNKDKDKQLLRRFNCNYCDIKFNKKYLLIKHIQHHTVTKTERPYECIVCEKRFAKKGFMVRHIKEHTEEQKTLAQKQMYDKKSLNYFECTLCERKFIRKYTLHRHLRTHTGDKPFECTICQRKFSQSGHLNTHLKRHRGEKSLECTVCQSKFIQKSALNRHLKTHTGEKPYECPICKHKFIQKSTMEMHLKTHTGEKPFKCTFCQHEFIQKFALISHVRTHTGEKPYECMICNKKFVYKSTMKSHLRIHTREKPTK